EMWALVRTLQSMGVTIILTTHYIEEAEEMADRIGVISHGEIILVEQKAALMRSLGKKELLLHLPEPIVQIPPNLAPYTLSLSDEGHTITYTYDTQGEQQADVTALLHDLQAAGIHFNDLQTRQSSLEDIFVSL